MKIKMKVIIILTAIATSWSQTLVAPSAWAELNGVSIDFAAAVPSTYAHATGGGAWNSGVIRQDIVRELEAENVACNDRVSYLTKISAPDSSDIQGYGSMTFDLKYSIGMDTTGASGIALGEVVTTLVNSNSSDSGSSGNENSAASLVDSSQSGDMFTKGALLFKTIRVTGVEAGENIIVRMDAVLHCQSGSTPTGNLQVKLLNAEVVFKNGGTAVNPAIQIGTGAKTVDLKGVQALAIPEITLQKTVTFPDLSCPGTEIVTIRPDQEVKYCYALTNTSGTGGRIGAPLYSVSVIADDSGPYPDFTVPFTSGLTDIDGDGQADDLAIGATAYATKVIAFDGNQDTVFTNFATVTGYDKTGVNQYPATDTASVNVDAPAPLISISKLTNGEDGPFILVGTTVTWSYLVTNTGDSPLSEISVVDDQIGAITCPSTSLDVSASMTCTATGTAVAGQYANSATVTATYSGNTYSATDTSSYFGANPAIDIQKSPDSQVVIEGQMATFDIVVTNTGNVDLTNVMVTDINSANCDKAIGNLAAGGQSTYSCTSPLISADLINTADVSANFGSTQISDTDSANVTVDYLPNIAVTKTATPESVWETGENVTFTFSVENKAPETFTLQTLIDDKFGDLNGMGTCQTPQTIAAGATYSCTLVKLMASDALVQHINVVTASGVDPEQHPASGSDNALVDFNDVKPSLGVTKSANPTSVPESGADVTFTYVVTNTATENLELTSLVDDKLGDLNGKGSCSVPQTIAPSAAFTCAFTVKIGNWNVEVITNVVTANGRDNDGNTTSNTAEASVIVTDVLPTISLTKSVNPTIVRSTGEYVDYLITITNTGPESVTVTSLVDNAVTLSPECEALVALVIPIAGSIQCAIHTLLTVNPGFTFVNTATANAQDNEGNTATAAGSASVKSYWFGRTPGYWKNHPAAWTSGYTPTQYVQNVFTIPGTLLSGEVLDLDRGMGKDTLIAALGYKGGTNLSGSAQILLRAAVAALLNKGYYGNDYPADVSVAQLIIHVNTVLATLDRVQYIALATYYDLWNNGVEGPLP